MSWCRDFKIITDKGERKLIAILNRPSVYIEDMEREVTQRIVDNAVASLTGEFIKKLSKEIKWEDIKEKAVEGFREDIQRKFMKN